LSLALAFCASQTDGAVIFDNGMPDVSATDYGRNITGWVQAEDFTLTVPTVLTAMHFWTAELPGNPWDGTLEYFLFDDVAGQPASTPFVSGLGVNIVRLNVGNPWAVNPNATQYEYSFDLDAPVNLLASTYWVGLHLASSYGPLAGDVYWATTSLALGASGAHSHGAPAGNFGSWNESAVHLAFNLTDGSAPAIPEPASMSLLALGALALRRRRR